MSFFIKSIALSGLMSRPPVSKHTPLPTSVTRGCSLSPHVSSISRGARSDARPTAWISGKFSANRSLPTVDLDVGAVARGERTRGGFELAPDPCRSPAC